MKRFGIILSLFFPAVGLSQPGYWVGIPPNPSWWIMAEELATYEQGGFTFTPVRISGGVPVAELAFHGIPNMAGGDDEARYFLFSGTSRLDTLIINNDTLFWEVGTYSWPGGIISPGDLTAPNRFAHTYSFVCGCYDYNEHSLPPDSARLADGFGFWQKHYPSPPEVPYWDGYLEYVIHKHRCIPLPCPGGDSLDLNTSFIFTDSLYNDLPPNVLLSGSSRLYFRGIAADSPDGASIELYLESHPEDLATVELTQYDQSTWRGSFENSKLLGLGSFDKLIGRLYGTGLPASNEFIDSSYIYVALPKIETSTDTVIIRTDSMKISQDFVASLYFKDDFSGNRISVDGRIDSAGYRYSSFWISNTSYSSAPSLHKRFSRHYPSDSAYLWWNDSTYNAATTFWRDSLYVVGGSLSVACVGALEPIPDIDNRFTATTDTVINDTTRATKVILVDSDPLNQPFIDSLGSDIIRAIAWVEWAGSNDHSHCDNPYNPRYNNYWDNVISGQDTCFETKHPCENIESTATGTMQMVRTVWQDAFSGPQYIPGGYYQASWDSIAWNWNINIFNGKYIYWTDNFFRINLLINPQRNWDSLYLPESDYTPDLRNKEDLSVYGYKLGTTKMMAIKDSLTWVNSVMNFFYVNQTRQHKHERPWNR